MEKKIKVIIIRPSENDILYKLNQLCVFVYVFLGNNIYDFVQGISSGDKFLSKVRDFKKQVKKNICWEEL